MKQYINRMNHILFLCIIHWPGKLHCNHLYISGHLSFAEATSKLDKNNLYRHLQQQQKVELRHHTNTSTENCEHKLSEHQDVF